MVHTFIVAPSAPRDLVATETSSQSLTLEWTRPEKLNGVVTKYIVKWAVNGSDTSIGDGFVNENVSNANNISFEIIELSDKTSYRVSVQVRCQIV